MRVLHLPHSTGGNAWNLSQGEKRLGLTSTVMITDPTQYSDDCDICVQSSSKYLRLLRYMLFCIRMASRYDLIHYNWGSMLFETKKLGLFGWDLKYFKRRGKVIAVTFQGSDARQAKYCVNHFDTTFYTADDVVELAERDAFIAQRISFYEKNADLIYATNPDLLRVLPERARFRPYTKLQPSEWEPAYSDYTASKTVIVHAPTKRNVKGTSYILAAIERLQAEGYEIDFRLLENIPNREVIAFYKEADLIIDQLLIGWYGGFAVECMALGKPVMCYIRESDMEYIPAEMNRDMPIIRVTRENLYERLKQTLDDKERLAQVARASRAYVEKWHDPTKIASSIIADYQKCLDHKRH